MIQKLALCPPLAWVSFVFVKNFSHFFIFYSFPSQYLAHSRCSTFLEENLLQKWFHDFSAPRDWTPNLKTSLQTPGSHFLWGHWKRTHILIFEFSREIVSWQRIRDLVQLIKCVFEPRFHRRAFRKKEKQGEKLNFEVCIGGATRVLKER